MTQTKPLDPDDVCPATGARHEPDWFSMTIDFDGAARYIDISCKDCRRGGCVGTDEALERLITW